jgi:hypothetical protein
MRIGKPLYHLHHYNERNNESSDFLAPPTGNSTNVTFSPVGIVYPLNHYKAFMLRGKTLVLMKKHPVKDGPLRMSGMIDSRLGGRIASRNGPKSRIRPRLPGKT